MGLGDQSIAPRTTEQTTTETGVIGLITGTKKLRKANNLEKNENRRNEKPDKKINQVFTVKDKPDASITGYVIKRGAGDYQPGGMAILNPSSSYSCDEKSIQRMAINKPPNIQTTDLIETKDLPREKSTKDVTINHSIIHTLQIKSKTSTLIYWPTLGRTWR